MDDPFAPQIAVSVDIKFGAFVGHDSEGTDVAFVTIVTASDDHPPLTYVLSKDQAQGVGRSLAEGFRS